VRCSRNTPDEPLRICVFVGVFPVLSETFVLRQIAGLSRSGHDVTIVAGKWGDRDCSHPVYRDNALEHLVVPIRENLDSVWQKLQSLLGFATNLALHVSDSRPGKTFLACAFARATPSLLDLAAIDERHLGAYDVILAHFGHAGMRALRLIQAGRIHGPLAVVFHGQDMSVRALLARHGYYRALFACGAQLLPISELWRERLIQWGADEARVRVLRMGVDLQSLPFADPERPLRRPLRVLSVARLVEKKGLYYALAGVLKAELDIQYTIAGEGPEEARLRALAGQAGPGKLIEFVGRKNQREVFELFDGADVFLLPSVIADDGDMEGVPVAIMEAMAKGLLVVSTRHSGIPELVDDGVSGWLVPERDAQAISRALEQLTRDERWVADVRRAARSSVEQRFDNAQLDADLDALCRRVASARY